MPLDYTDLVQVDLPQKEALCKWSDRIRRCNWFENVGTGVLGGVERAESWRDVERLMGEDPHCRDWEDMLNLVSNEASLRAFQENADRYQTEWTRIASLVMDHVDNLLEETLAPVLNRLGVSRIVLNFCRGQTRGLYVHIAYFDDPEASPIYRTLLGYYLAGYCPCGYAGKYPDGRLVVY
jgi:hypothetical protein